MKYQIPYECALVLEDNPAHLEFAVRLLTNIGIPTVLSAEDGASGLEMMWSHTPDLIVCDVDMPGIDGMGVIRELPKLPRVPAVLLVSAIGSEVLRTVERIAKRQQLDVVGVAEKPLNIKTLRETLSRSSDRESRTGTIAPELSKDEILVALQENRFVPFFEPRINRKNGHCDGAEMLARLISPDGAVIPPVRFIAALERMGAIEKMTWQVLDKGLEALRNFDQQGFTASLSINISPEMLGENQLAAKLAERVQKFGIEAERMTLEITETAAVSENDECLESMTRMRIKGFRLSIDDFGTGFSSLSQLSNAPVTELKIDQQFSFDAPQDPKARAVCETGIDLAHKLNLHTCAEGVENHEVFQLLYDLGADSFQGYLFSRPMPSEKFLEWAKQWNESINWREFYLREP